MRPDDNPPQHPREDNEVARAIDELAAPLTAIHGYAQLLQRRVRAGRTISDENLLITLGRIERAARTMEARLRQLEDDTARREK